MDQLVYCWISINIYYYNDDAFESSFVYLHTRSHVLSSLLIITYLFSFIISITVCFFFSHLTIQLYWNELFQKFQDIILKNHRDFLFSVQMIVILSLILLYLNDMNNYVHFCIQFKKASFFFVLVSNIESIRDIWWVFYITKFSLT